MQEIRRSEYEFYWSQKTIADRKNNQKKQEIDDQLASPPARSSKRIKVQKVLLLVNKCNHCCQAIINFFF